MTSDLAAAAFDAATIGWLAEPTQVPGGQWKAQARDPQGAHCGIVRWER